jgi:hypothetical protein
MPTSRPESYGVEWGGGVRVERMQGVWGRAENRLEWGEGGGGQTMNSS